MKTVLSVLVFAIALAEIPIISARVTQPEDDNDEGKQAQAPADAENAHIAAHTARKAAKVANKVAEHSVHITEHAKSALKDAHDALHKARVDTSGLSDDQKHSLKKAEAKLKEATRSAEYGQLKNAKYVKVGVDNKKLQKMQNKMEDLKIEREEDELETMRKEIRDLKKQLKQKGIGGSESKRLLQDLEELETDIEKMKNGNTDAKSRDEMKAEIEHLRAQIKDLEDEGKVSYQIPSRKNRLTHSLPTRAPIPVEEDEKKYDVRMRPLSDRDGGADSQAAPVQEKGIDIDTEMPYGDLEPFGREDTAQELTESSIRESDEMIDQLERAEVAEEKRAVFRALTRLRGAAITSFDGVARAQTGNIDEYSKVHQWRRSHPLHHLANEESDVTKWAFPDDAD